MVELWSIEPSPTPKDPSRHTLWVKGPLADVQALIRRFGAICGRPQKERPDSEYDFSIYLHGAGPEALGRVETWLKTVGPEVPSPSPARARHGAPGNGSSGVATPPPVFLPPPPEPVPAPAPAGPESLSPGEPVSPPEPAPEIQELALPPALPPAPALEPVAAEPALPEPALPAPGPAGPESPSFGAPEPAGPESPSFGAPEPAGPESPSMVAPAPTANPFDALLPPMQPPPSAKPGLSAFADLASPGTPPPAEAALPEIGAVPPLPVQEPEPAPLMRTPTPPPAQAPAAEAPAPGDNPFMIPPPLSEAPSWPGESPTATQGATGGPPPLTEAPAWGPSTTGGPAPGPALGPGDSPFTNLPPAPSVFPVPQEPTPAAPEAAPAPAPMEMPSIAPAPAPAAGPAIAAVPAAEGPMPETLTALAPSPLGELFGAALPLNPFYTMDTLQVGSFNRFSHAASMSVISNPGAMYNPLFLFGGPGVGKTHLLHAIGKALQEPNPSDTLFVTTGPRLARAVAEAKKAGRVAEIEAFAKKARAILIDDIHVLGVNEHNQEALAQLLASCFSSAKQVVMTSVYPPRALGALEEALRFQISAGWSVDMKPVTLEVQKEILGPTMARAGFELDAALIDGIIPKLEGSFGELNRWSDRLRALLELRALNHQPSSLQDLFPILLMPDVPATAPAPTEEIQSLLEAMQPNPQDAKALPTAVFFPQGRDVHGEFIARQFHAVMSQNKWPIVLKIVHSQPYDPEQLFGVPFVIGDATHDAGARVALVLGPNPGSGLASREVEFQHAVQHLLEGIDLRVGWVNFLKIKEVGPYFRAGLDVFGVFRSHA
ncbi:MAG: ATP-binding protein [Elusimicrobia bacterium]|nr:ATP-binding protein [Elusimicrobiota bacterium]